VGRFSGDRLVARFGAVRVFRASVLVAGAGLGGALAAHAPAAGFAGLALLGGGLAFALPLSISAGGNLPDHSPGVAAARVSTLGYLGSFTGPALIGVLASALDLRAALVLPAAIVAATALGARSVASAQSGPDRA
jgi:MFS family permease